MRKDFDYLHRNTYFSVGATDELNVDLLHFCEQFNFRHIMIWENNWLGEISTCSSKLPKGHEQLKTFIRWAHERDIIVSLHGRITDIKPDDVLIAEPICKDLVKITDRYFVENGSPTHFAICREFSNLIDTVNADGFHLDGCGLAAARHGWSTPEYWAAAAAMQRPFVEALTRPLILQAGSTTEELHDWWCFSGHRDHYPNVKRSGWKGTRQEWNEVYVSRTQEALALGYPSQVGWLDIGHDRKMPDGTEIEDQTVESVKFLTDYAKTHNLPMIVETSQRELNTHPQRDEILELIKGV